MVTRYSLKLLIMAVFLQPAAGLSQPKGIAYEGSWHNADITFLADTTWVNRHGLQRTDQQIFDRLFQVIAHSREFILLDMFLFNSFTGEQDEPLRQLSRQLTDLLIERKQQFPDIQIIVITDPINTVYGSISSELFSQLQKAGIVVVFTKLEKLNDSNTVYSKFWRIFVKPFGRGKEGGWLPNPFGEGRVSLRTYLRILNFKANHRKIMVADTPSGLTGFVMSANAHDGSSAHHNVAVQFTGAAVYDLLVSEQSVLDFSGHEDIQLPVKISNIPEIQSRVKLKILTENKIKQAVLEWLDKAREGYQIDLMMFYLSDRDIVNALKKAHQRGAVLRILLDPNKDAFGREKNGIPNRPVATELVKKGIALRWCNTHGEQCHSKLLIVRSQDNTTSVILGSANYTRRNLDNFNLETNVAMKIPEQHSLSTEVLQYFNQGWKNLDGKFISVDYESYQEESKIKKMLYRFMESSGFSTF